MPDASDTPTAEPYIDPVIEAYKPGIDLTLIRENLKLSVEERVNRMAEHVKALDAIRGTAPASRVDE